MMRASIRFFGICVFVNVLFIWPTFVLAQTNLIDQTTTLDAGAQQRVRSLTAALTTQFDTVINRLINIASRIERRQTELEKSNYDTSLAKTYVASATSSLGFARSLSAQTNDLVQTATISAEPKKDWNKARAHILQTKQYILNAHNQLLRAVDALKKAPRTDLTATTTASSSANSE